MIEDSITLALNGRVTLEAYKTAILALTELLHALQAEISPGSTAVWEIDDLQISSAIATVRATAGDPGDIRRVTQAYLVVGKAMAKGEPIPFPATVQRPAGRITSIISESLPSVRFENASEDATILGPTSVAPPRSEIEEFGAFGAVPGRIQTVSNRIGIRFTLYDSLFDRAVSCYLTEDSLELIRGLWGTRVVVHGLVRRDPISGRPVVVRQISDIEPIAPDDPNRYSYLNARGSIAARPEGEKPEEVIRRLRNAR